jgi:colanic acid/amylovoran biosynthesis protein
MNIILANLPINNANKGCVALSVSIMFLLNKLLKEKSISYKFYLPDSGYKSKGMYTIKVGDSDIEFYTCDYADWSDPRTSLKQLALWIFKRELFKTNRKVFKNADFIFDIGQGDSFADIYGKERFEMIDKIHKVARKNKIPYCLLPQTIGPFKNEQIKSQAIESMNKADLVMARDFQSFSFVKENCPGIISHEYIDVAFFMPYEKQNFSNDFIHLGLNVSSLLWHGGYTQNNQFGLKCNYQQLIYDIIEFFLNFPNLKIHLVGHVVSGESDIENDYEVCYHLANKYASEKVILSPLFLTPIFAKNYIGGMDFFVGARMHAAIAAFSCGVPVYPMAYSRKFNGLFMDTLSYPYMGDLVNQDLDKIMKDLKKAFEQREILKQIISERMNGVVEEKKELIMMNISRFFKLS